VSSEVANGLDDLAEHGGECFLPLLGRLGMQAVYQSRQVESIG
jgi:hypothetical protein